MKFVVEPIERDADVVDFSHAIIVLAVAQAGTPKVEAQHGHAEAVQRLHRVEDHLVVQRASVFGMWVADQGRVGGVGRAGVQQRLELAGGTVQEKGSNDVRSFRHGYRVQRGNLRRFAPDGRGRPSLQDLRSEMETRLSVERRASSPVLLRAC